MCGKVPNSKKKTSVLSLDQKEYMIVQSHRCGYELFKHYIRISCMYENHYTADTLYTGPKGALLLVTLFTIATYLCVP